MYSKDINETLTFGSVLTSVVRSAAKRALETYVQTCEQLVCDYEVVGKAIFVSISAPGVYELHSSDTINRQRAFLLLPSDSVTRLNDLTCCHKIESYQNLLQSLLRQHVEDGNGAGAKPRRSLFGLNKNNPSSANQELKLPETATEVEVVKATEVVEEPPQEYGELLTSISEAYTRDTAPSDSEVLDLIVHALRSRYTEVDVVGLDDILKELENLEGSLQAEVTIFLK
jgi:hypothetical protein